MHLRRVSRLAGLSLGLAVVVGFGASTSRAEYLQFTSTSTVTPLTPPLINPTSGTENFTQGTFTQTAPYAGLAAPDGNEVRVLALASNSAANNINANAPFGSDIVIAAFDALAPTGTAVDTVNFNYSVKLTFTDYASETSTAPLGTGTITVSGRLNGIIGNGQVFINNFDFATSPAGGSFTTNNGDTFTLSLPSFTRPGASNDGTLGIHVVRSVPEPASMVMLGLGGLGAVGLFRRRKAAIAS